MRIVQEKTSRANVSENMHSNFVDLLVDRVKLVRPTIELDPANQLKGLRFRSDDFVIDIILMTLETKTGDMDGMIPQETMDLDFDDIQVLSGKFDPLIRFTLRQLAALDFSVENRIDLN